MSKAAAAAPEGEAAPKAKSKLMLIVGVAVLVLAIAGAGAFFMLKKKPAEEGEDGEAEAAPAKTAHAKGKKDEKHAPPTFVPMEAFTVNLLPENGEQYLQVMFSLKLEDAHVAEELKVYVPELRHRVLMLLSGKKASELAGVEGREELATEIMSAANETLGFSHAPKKKGSKEKEPEHTGKKEPVEGPVVAVMFTSFIIQ